jgi:hypothetical protein
MVSADWTEDNNRDNRHSSEPLATGLGPESFGGPSFRLGRFFFPIPGGRIGFERTQKAARHARDFIDRAQEGGFIGFGRLVEAADLSDELQRRGSDLVVRDRGIEVEEDFYIPAHAL